MVWSKLDNFGLKFGSRLEFGMSFSCVPLGGEFGCQHFVCSLSSATSHSAVATL